MRAFMLRDSSRKEAGKPLGAGAVPVLADCPEVIHHPSINDTGEWIPVCTQRPYHLLKGHPVTIRPMNL